MSGTASGTRLVTMDGQGRIHPRTLAVQCVSPMRHFTNLCQYEGQFDSQDHRLKIIQSNSEVM